LKKRVIEVSDSFLPHPRRRRERRQAKIGTDGDVPNGF